MSEEKTNRPVLEPIHKQTFSNVRLLGCEFNVRSLHLLGLYFWVVPYRN